MLVTKADLLAGFTEYFADLTKEERAQVFGFTLPYDPDAPDAREARFDARVVEELDALEARLVARMPERLHAETGLPQRAAIFGFPQQFAALKPRRSPSFCARPSSSRVTTRRRSCAASTSRAARRKARRSTA